MNIKLTKLLVPFLGLCLLFTSCSDSNDSIDATEASLIISLKGTTPQMLSRASKPTTQRVENTINKMMVLVFANGDIEAKQELAGSEGKITGLITGNKDIIVVANPTNDVLDKLKAVTKQSELQNIVTELAEEWNGKGEMNSYKGFTMTGQANITLKAGNDNKAEIVIKRIVAKVILGQVDIKLMSGFDANKFELKSVSMMKVRSKSLLGLPNYLLNTKEDLFSYLGGEKATISKVEEAQLVDYTIKEGENNIYFYVTPNDNTDDNCTLMVIKATYDGEEQDFAFRINDKEVKGAEELTGKYLEANHQYTLNVTIKKPQGGGTEEPRTTAELEVVVTPEDWIVVPSQNVEW